MNTHYALAVFSGDFDGDHPDIDLRGTGPSVTLLAAGPEAFCWQAAASWTKRHPLRRDEVVEVVARDIVQIVNQQEAAAHYLATLEATQPAEDE